ncbi:sulfotransferase domain-containing protein [Frigidibacter mobilis]|uniref:sulfotransferase domain-containing protein n=1 Tax=Frigidibacter mobilis TaxID=1335048 RepID=UPI0014121D50|nr:sulfotransferase domain-containing protein [Frigidibacter mobilis]
MRKAKAFANRVPRLAAHLSAKEEDYRARPPIIVNSLPKSGTHLLMQIAQELPDRRYFGSFIAQTPSMTLRMRSQGEIDRKIAAIVPGEVLGTHLYYTPETEAALRKINAIHLFIWRDPRDVLLSEAHYLAKMNRWHAMHKAFAALPDAETQVRFAITGNGGNYPGAEERIGSYMGWLTSDSCLSLRYEELVDPQTQLGQCQRILDVYKATARAPGSLPSAEMLVDAINPARSHTFNRGGIGRWRKEMSPANLALCEERLGPWLAS